MRIPSHFQLLWPTLKAIKALGGSGSNSEIVEKVIELKKFPEEIQNEMHLNGPQTELEYRLAWSRTILRTVGALENSARAVWSLTEKGANIKETDIPKVIEEYQQHLENMRRNQRQKSLSQGSDDDSKDNNTQRADSLNDDPPECNSWRAELLHIIQNKISPSGFERLVQRILREFGFVEVEVTGRTGDQGVDGSGILKVGLLSFRVIFQCKRYRGVVVPSYIRDFRGAMQGRAEKGLFMTTGSFTSAAKKEATRDGVPLIELFDGNDICNLMKDLRLGLDVETKECVTIKQSWFEQLKKSEL